MTWTWTEIISRALVRSGLLGRKQIPDPSMYVEGKEELSLLLDDWDGQGLALPAFDSEIEFNTVAGQALYWLGEGPETEAYAVRPETIVIANCTIASNPAVIMTMAPMDYSTYKMISVPDTQSQPWNYAVNESWPQMQLFLYPTPNAIYPITLSCKVKWESTVGNPDLNPFVTAEVPSGYANALVNGLALRIAEKYKLDSTTLEAKDRNSRLLLGLAVANQAAAAMTQQPRGLFSWNILTAGRNP